MKTKCVTCKKVFETTPKAVSEGRGKNCSKECQSKSYRKGVSKICEFCKKAFHANPSMLETKKCRFCSHKCHMKWKRENRALFSGENSRSWQGGKTTLHARIRASQEYKNWRVSVFKRDKYTCIWCGEKSRKGKAIILHADHIKPFAYFPELRFELSNGRTLCKECHKYTASYMGKSKRYYGKKKKFVPVKDRIEYGGIIVGAEEHDAIIHTVFSQGGRRWTMGPECGAFEKELAEVVGVRYSVLVNSGSSALLAAMTALHLPKGSKIIIPALNFPTAYSSILQTFNMPVVVDCELSSLNLDLKEVKKAIKLHPDIKAVVAVHIAGNVVDLIKLREIVGDRIIISDNCDGLGGTLDGKYIDTYSDVSCVSFHAAHIIGLGEGGAVLTDNKDYADRARKIREWGRASGSDTLTKHEGFPPDYRERYVFEEVGYNLKPLELQAAMGRIQLKKLEQFKEQRKKNYDKLYGLLKDTNFRLMKEVVGAENCWFSVPLLTKDRPRVMDTFEKHNIETRTIFSGNILRHPAYKNEPHIKIGDLANSDYVMHHGMFLSAHPFLTDEMIDYMGEVANSL